MNKYNIFLCPQFLCIWIYLPTVLNVQENTSNIKQSKSYPLTCKEFDAKRMARYSSITSFKICIHPTLNRANDPEFSCRGNL